MNYKVIGSMQEFIVDVCHTPIRNHIFKLHYSDPNDKSSTYFSFLQGLTRHSNTILLHYEACPIVVLCFSYN